MSKVFERREDIPVKYTWDLSFMYENVEAWEKDFAKVSVLCDELVALKGTLTQSGEQLLKGLEKAQEIEKVFGSVFTYAKMRQDENTKDGTFQALTARATSLMAKVQETVSFMNPEILSADADEIRKLYKEYAPLNLYEQALENLLRNKPHTLSDAEEMIIAKTTEMQGTAQQAFGMLNAADLKFPEIEDDKGEKVRVTQGNYVPFMESKDRRVRQDAFKAMYSTYKDHINTAAALLQGDVKKNMFNASVRKHSSARASALHENNVPESVYDSLIEAVHGAFPAFYKYMDLRKKMLGVDELHMYDVYTPIVKDVDMTIPYDEAVETMNESLKILGNDYTDVVKQAVVERWIDVYENEGKRSGAYSWGTNDSRPYILLNHHDTLDNMFTLVHEMGHSMHSYLTAKNQPDVYANYSIFVAEVASTTNEALLNHHLLNTIEDPKQKLFVLNHYLEQFRGTIFRQTMFAEFERDIHQMAERGEALTAESLCAHYKSLNEKYFGPSMIIDDEIQYEWARIPHFYYNFYVFQYATGFSAAIAFSQKMINEGQEAIDKYLNFLSSGSKDYPINILREAGVDMETKEPVANALKLFGELVDEMEKLLA